MENRVKTPKMEPYEHDLWRIEVLSYHPQAFIQDDTTSSALRERALNKGQLVGFFLRSHATQQGSGYVIHPEVGGSVESARAGIDQSGGFSGQS